MTAGERKKKRSGVVRYQRMGVPSATTQPHSTGGTAGAWVVCRARPDVFPLSKVL